MNELLLKYLINLGEMAPVIIPTLVVCVELPVSSLEVSWCISFHQTSFVDECVCHKWWTAIHRIPFVKPEDEQVVQREKATLKKARLITLVVFAYILAATYGPLFLTDPFHIDIANVCFLLVPFCLPVFVVSRTCLLILFENNLFNDDV